MWGTKSSRAVDVETAVYACETVDAFGAWRVAHPDHSVTISRTTMRPMEDPALGEDERLFAMADGTLGMGEAREINTDA